MLRKVVGQGLEIQMAVRIEQHGAPQTRTLSLRSGKPCLP
jgi:hypothetical protein